MPLAAARSAIPNPQSLIPNPQSPTKTNLFHRKLVNFGIYADTNREGFASMPQLKAHAD